MRPQFCKLDGGSGGTLNFISNSSLSLIGPFDTSEITFDSYLVSEVGWFACKVMSFKRFVSKWIPIFYIWTCYNFTFRSVNFILFIATPDPFSTLSLTGISWPETYPRFGRVTFTAKGAEAQHKQQKLLFISVFTGS